MKRPSQLGKICLKFLLLFIMTRCSSLQTQDDLKLKQAWVPVLREERTYQWELLDNLEGLSLMNPLQGGTSESFSPPYDPVYPSMLSLFKKNSPMDIPSENFIRNSIPPSWGWAQHIHTWLVHEHEIPQSPEEVGIWLIKAEEVFQDHPHPKLRSWIRRRYLNAIQENPVFWSPLARLNGLTIDLLAENFEKEIKDLDAESRSVWLLYWSHILETAEKPSEAPIQNGALTVPPLDGRQIREEIVLRNPSDRVIQIMSRYYRSEYPPATSLLPSASQLKHARALFEHGEVQRSLKIALSLYRRNPPPLKEDASLLIEQIYRSRGDVEKQYEWRLINNQGKKKVTASPKERKKQPELSSTVPDPILEPDKFYKTVRTLWNANQSNEALNLIEIALGSSEKLTETLNDDLRFLLVNIKMEKAEWIAAIQILESLADKNPKKKEIQWPLCTSYVYANEFEKAARCLESYLKNEEDPLSRTKAFFWKSYAEENLGRNEERVKTLFQLMDEDPVSYYSEMALQAIQSEGKQPAQLKIPRNSIAFPPLFISSPVPKLAVASQSPPLKPSQSQEFFFLLYLPDPELSRLWLSQFSPKKIPPEWYAAVGQHIFSIPQLVEWRRSGKPLPEYFHRLYFPREYWDYVKDSANRYGVDPFLILALIRQESIFKENAVSEARAMGIMQLLPGTAQEVHRSLPSSSPIKREKFRAENLFNPQWSIELGTFHFSRLLKYYKGNWIAAIGGYNAGPKAMTTWMKARYHSNPLLFIERIPYQETKYYIQLVLRNYSFYKRIYDGGVPPLALQTPQLALQ